MSTTAPATSKQLDYIATLVKTADPMTVRSHAKAVQQARFGGLSKAAASALIDALK